MSPLFIVQVAASIFVVLFACIFFYIICRYGSRMLRRSRRAMNSLDQTAQSLQGVNAHLKNEKAPRDTHLWAYPVIITTASPFAWKIAACLAPFILGIIGTSSTAADATSSQSLVAQSGYSVTHQVDIKIEVRARTESRRN